MLQNIQIFTWFFYLQFWTSLSTAFIFRYCDFFNCSCIGELFLCTFSRSSACAQIIIMIVLFDCGLFNFEIILVTLLFCVVRMILFLCTQNSEFVGFFHAVYQALRSISCFCLMSNGMNMTIHMMLSADMITRIWFSMTCTFCTENMRQTILKV